MYDRGTLSPVFMVVVVIVALGLIIFAVSFRSEKRIKVEKRWWATSTSVKWDESNYVCKQVSEYVCTGYGEDRSCSTETSTDCSWETTTHTRCTTHSSGESLPVVYPEPGCRLYSGDYISKHQAYWLIYLEKDKQRKARFKSGLWDTLKPGFYRQVKVNVLGTIVEIAPE